MGSVGDAYDKAIAKSLFAMLECELLDRTKFRTRAEAKIAVFEWIEGCGATPTAGLRSWATNHPSTSRANTRSGKFPKARNCPRNRGYSNA